MTTPKPPAVHDTVCYRDSWGARMRARVAAVGADMRCTLSIGSKSRPQILQSITFGDGATQWNYDDWKEGAESAEAVDADGEVEATDGDAEATDGDAVAHADGKPRGKKKGAAPKPQTSEG